MPIRQRFWIAMFCYGVLALVAWRNFQGPLRLALWVLLAGLAVKTWIAAFKRLE